MNVIISNKCQDMFASLQIDVIKSMNGEFDADEIISTFGNFYFQRLILDITALKDYKDIRNLQKLSINLNMDRVILVLDDSEDATSTAYLSKLISIGIYNFTRNMEGIMYLYNHPNTYRDVAHIHQLETVTTVVQQQHGEGPANAVTTAEGGGSARVIGIKNVTDHAGATSMIAMLKNRLDKYYSVVAIEVDRHDFMFFNESKDLVSVPAKDLAMEILKYKDRDIILVDMNLTNDESIYNEVLYLVEPSSFKLRKMMRRDRKIFERLHGTKVVLNQSLLDSKNILDFEYEAKLKVFYNIPPLDDKEENHRDLNILLSKLGFNRQPMEASRGTGSILDIFRS